MVNLVLIAPWNINLCCSFNISRFVKCLGLIHFICRNWPIENITLIRLMFPLRAKLQFLYKKNPNGLTVDLQIYKYTVIYAKIEFYVAELSFETIDFENNITGIWFRWRWFLCLYIYCWISKNFAYWESKIYLSSSIIISLKTDSHLQLVNSWFQYWIPIGQILTAPFHVRSVLLLKTMQ